MATSAICPKGRWCVKPGRRMKGKKIAPLASVPAYQASACIRNRAISRSNPALVTRRSPKVAQVVEGSGSLRRTECRVASSWEARADPCAPDEAIAVIPHS
jgi:hypothetical protein